MRVALLLSTDTFEHFFERQLKLTADEYVSSWRGGWVWSYCRMLSREGLQPSVYVASMVHSGRHETPEGYGVRFLPLQRWYAPWVRFPAIRRTPPARYVSGFANGAALTPALRRSLAEDRIDVLCIQEYWTGRYDYLAGRIPIPFVAVHQGGLDRRAPKFAKRRTFARAAAMTTQTRGEADKVRRFGAAATPIPNGVDAEFFAPADVRRDGAARTVLCVARLLDEHKRQSDLIRAIALLPDAWSLELVGHGPDRERLGRLAHGAGVGHRVRFHGFVSGEADLRDHLQRCDVFALVSRHEGMPVALLEAMSCGAAVVGTDIPGIGEVLEDGVNGVVVPVGRPDLIAAAIEAAYVRREQLGRRAREAITRTYSERAVGARLAEAIRAAAGRR